MAHSHRKYKENPPACQAEPSANRRPSPGAIGAGVLLAGAGLAVSTFAYAYFATHPLRLRVRRTPEESGLPYEAISFLSRDGLRISGWYLPAPAEQAANGVVIVCHGYPMNRAEMLPHARMLHAAGFATLLFDFRALGESEGDLCSVGLHEVEDLRGALDYLADRPDTAHLPVGALGHSLGGAVAILTAAQDDRLKAIVAEASYPTLHDALDARCRVFLGPLAPPVVHSVSWWAQKWVPVNAREISPLDAIGRIGPRAVLLIQGQRDLLVRWRDAVRMYEAAREPRELWLIPRSGHARCLKDQPEEYARRVAAFFHRHLTA